MLKDYPFEAPFFSPDSGLRFSGNIVNYIDRLIYFSGAHEKYMLCLLRDYAQALRAAGAQALTFVDVGANAGNHVLFMAKQVEKVVAFEPFARVREQMQENLALNQVSNVTIHPCGLSDRRQVLPFYAANETNLGASSFAPGHRKDSTLLGELQLEVGDAMLAQAGRADMVKIDVEGFEKPVLLGLRETLKRDRPLLVVEFTPTTRESIADEAEFFSLFPADYAFYYFGRGDNASGRYQLAEYRYAMTPKIEDVIACPKERVAAILSCGKG